MQWLTDKKITRILATGIANFFLINARQISTCCCLKKFKQKE